jgi:hypothetical protein
MTIHSFSRTAQPKGSAMLNFDFFNQRAEVKRALSSRLNHTTMDTLRYQDRKAQRSNYSEVVWLIPIEGKHPNYAKAVPAVSKDLSIQGLSLIHNAPLTESLLVVGIPGEHGTSFFQCNVEHCSSLGYGFYQIGLFPVKLLTQNMSEMKAWETRTAEFQTQPTPEPVA